MTTITIIDHVLYVDGVPVQDLPKLPDVATVSVWAVPKEYVADGYFVGLKARNAAAQIPACASSDAHLLATLELPADDQAVVNRARLERMRSTNIQADALLAALDETYPEREVLTWDQQVKEAEARQTDPAASVPLLASLAAYRGIELDLLAAKVLEKAELYAITSGRIMGARQWVEKALEAATTHADVIAVPSIADRLETVEAEA